MIDDGVLRIGPQSAGSHPGPACFSRGGTAPTLTDAYLLAAMGQQVALDGDLSAYPMRLASTHAGCNVREVQSGHGMLVEVDIDSLQSLPAQLGDRDQTLVQYGFDSEELAALLRSLGGRAIDRVTPVGRALDFHHVWDGIDLFRVLTRQTTLSSG